MRRPWELRRMKNQGGPLVYVPVSLPDTNSSSFAVLELVGFSSSPDSFQSCAAPSLSSLQQSALISHSQAQQLPPSVSLNLPSCALITSLDTPLSPHTESSVKISIESPQISMSGARDTAPAPPSMPSEAKRTAAMDGVKVVQIGTKENIVHTTSLNFKDVVQKLTGASPNDQDIMPVTVPNRSFATLPIGGKASPNKVLDALSVKVDASKGFKKASSKLHERRKAFHNLDRLSTNKRVALAELSLAPLAPSPVTPLASYFDMFCNATTPTTSQSSRSPSISSPGHSFLDSDSLKGAVIAPSAIDVAQHFMPTGGVHAKIQQHASLVETLPNPSLLSLFPESPLCSSEDFLSHPP